MWCSLLAYPIIQEREFRLLMNKELMEQQSSKGRVREKDQMQCKLMRMTAGQQVCVCVCLSGRLFAGEGAGSRDGSCYGGAATMRSEQRVDMRIRRDGGRCTIEKQNQMEAVAVAD